MFIYWIQNYRNEANKYSKNVPKMCQLFVKMNGLGQDSRNNQEQKPARILF